jgi:CRISPR-associated protein Cas1
MTSSNAETPRPQNVETEESDANGDRQSTPLIPLAMLNAFVYCPRRFHYEFVQGVMEDNEHVVHGRRTHARVDDPALSERPRREGEAIHTRSVWLTSDKLGITGKIDLVEEKDGEIVPVEYKKGRPPGRDRCPDGYWENDAVQLCSQALLLEECENRWLVRGYLYFAAARQRVEVPMLQTLREKTLAAIAAARRLSEEEETPSPLMDSPKCPSCSLVTLCMPDETNRLRECGAGGSPVNDPERFPIPTEPLRCLIPSDYDTEILYLTEQGATVGKSGDQFIVRNREGQTLAEVPGARLRQICVYGYGQLTTQAVHACMDLGIDVAFLSTGGRFKGRLAPNPSPNGLLRSAVARSLQSEAVRLSVAREIISAKIANQRVMLMRNTREDAKGPEFERAVADLAELTANAPECDSRERLLGVEGFAGRVYFARFNGMLREDSRDLFAFASRNRRPPRDPVNALLSLAYACLCKDVMSAVATVGLDPYLGALHEPRHGQPALALDLMEEFRPIIADSVVLTLVNNRMLAAGDFVRGRQSCNLTDEGRKTFFEAYEKRKADECTHPVFGYKTSYVRLIEMQARVLARFLTGQIGVYCGFRTR